MIQLTFQEDQQKKVLASLPKNLHYKVEKCLEENFTQSKTTASVIDKGDNHK